MQGAAPLASPGLNPGGAGAGGEPRARWGAAIPVACRPCRSGIRRGGLPSLSPARPAFSSISFPYPPDPLPGGKGENLVFLCKGLRPLHPPGAEPGRHLGRGANHAPGGGRRFRSPVNLAVPESAGAACLPCRRLVLPLALFLSPRPPSPVGKGENFSFLMQGAAPLAFPGLNPGGTGAGGEPRAQWGGRQFRLPADLDICFIPPSPRPPSPVGKGEIISSFRRGLRPRHPGGGSLRFGARGKGIGCYRLSRAVRVQPRGCKGRSPLHETTLVSPSPEGKGRGMGAKHPSVFAGAPPPAPRRREPTVRRKRGGIGCLQVSRCQTGSAPGMQGAKPLA